MECPKCKKEIDRVIIFGETQQIGYIEYRTRKIDFCAQPDIIKDFKKIQCPECHAVITKYIRI